ncbi:MAG: hypothetical protein NVS9B3_01160 [Gemmatimonadaceae bacterium]
MSDASPRSTHDALARRIEGARTAADLAGVKPAIIALAKDVERQLTELTALKEDIKKLAERWKTAVASSEGSGGITQRPTARASTSSPGLSTAPAFTAEKPTVHADHLGASTFIEKGWSNLSAGRYEAAESALVKALELSPNDPQSEALLGWAQMLQEKYDDALLNFQKVLMRQPANGLARINVGYICLKKGIFGEAIEHLSKAIRLETDRKATLYAHFYLGLVYLQREMYEDAQSFFRKTLTLGPNLIEAYYELGRAHWFNGERETAMRVWRDGFAANKFNPWGKRCGEVLAAVEAGDESPLGS